MKVLVTGATGFLGSHIVDVLLERGHSIRALARKSSNVTRLREQGVEIAYGVLERGDGLDDAVRGVDVIIHSAGLVRARSEAEFLETNEGGTKHLAEAAVRSAPELKAFIYVSSSEVGGPNYDGHPHPDGSPPNPITLYGKSKLAGERAALGVKDKLPVFVVRPCAIYGPRDREILQFFELAAKGLFPILTSPSGKLSLIYGEDCARAIVALAEKPTTSGTVYDVDDGEIYTWGHVADVVTKSVGRSRSLRVRVPKLYLRAVATVSEAYGKIADKAVMVTRDKLASLTAPHQITNSVRFRDEVGWKRSVSLTEGVQRTADWYKAEGWI